MLQTGQEEARSIFHLRKSKVKLNYEFELKCNKYKILNHNLKGLHEVLSIWFISTVFVGVRNDL